MIVEHLEAHGIGYTQEGRHSHDGWVQLLECPFCNSGGTHLGINTRFGAANCYKCGGKSWFQVCTALEIPYLSINGKDAPLERDVVIDRKPVLKLPSEVGELTDPHRRYLEGRGMLASIATTYYGIGSTGGRHPMTGNRIYIPIHDPEGLQVSWQLRAVNNHKIKYFTCKDTDALYPLKDLLYGEHLVTQKRGIILVEGVFDVYAFPIGMAVACLGKVLTEAQILRLAKFDSVYVCLDQDADPRPICRQLGPFCNVSDVCLETGDDPSEASKEEINEIVQHVRSLM